MRELIVSDAKDQYADFEAKLGEEGLRQLERRVVLAVLDRKWREHLYEMDYLKDGIGLRGMGQRDPLVEYQREGYQMYNSMIEAIKEEPSSCCSTLTSIVSPPPKTPKPNPMRKRP